MSLVNFTIILLTTCLVVNIYFVGQFITGKWCLEENLFYFKLGCWNIMALAYLVWLCLNGSVFT